MTKSKADDSPKTDEGKATKQTPPVNVVDTGTDEELTEHHRELTHEEALDLVGELEPGEEGWVPLNEKGEIIGPAKRGPSPVDQLSAKVVAPPDDRTPPLTTPSGARLSKRMNPDPDSLKPHDTVHGDEKPPTGSTE